MASERRALEIVFPAPGHAEQDARALVDVAASVLANVVSGVAPGEAVMLGIANQRSTVILWDGDTGRPLGPALSWRDSRAQAQARDLAAAIPDIGRRTGLTASAHYGAPKITWALRHWPEAAAAARNGSLRVGPVSTWIVWKLSGGAAFTIDPTNAQRMLLLDLHALEWDDELLRASGIPRAALPQVLPTDGAFGEVLIAGRHVSVRTMLGDQQAVLAGRRSQDESEVAVQLGTGGFVLRDTGPRCAEADGLLSGIARADVNQPRRYLVEGPVNSAGSALDRLKDIGLLADSDDIDALCEAATAPVTVVPAWGGLGAPWWSGGSRAALMGWDESTTRADIVAGTVRGIAFLVADIVDAMTRGGLPVTTLALSGSVSRLRCVAQALADATRLELTVRDDPEATIHGVAAALAAATDAVAPPPPTDGEGLRVQPRGDLTSARRAFDAARSAVMGLAAGSES